MIPNVKGEETVMRSTLNDLKGKEILFLCWYSLAAVAYLFTAGYSVLNPINIGQDLLLAIAWAVLLTAALVLHLRWRHPRVTEGWLILLALIAALLTVCSGSAFAVVTALGVWALAWSWGEEFLNRLGLGEPRSLFIAIVAILLGLAGLSLFVLILLVIGRFDATVVWGLLTLLAALQWRRLSGIVKAFHLGHLLAWRKWGLSTADRLLVVFIGLVGVTNLIWVLAPEIQFDSLNYHLAVPKFRIQTGALTDLSYNWHSYFAQLVEALFTLALITGGQTTAKAFAFGFGLATLGTVYTLGRHYFGRQVGLLAAAIFYATPLVMWSSTTTYVELAVAAFLTATLAIVLQWVRDRNPDWLAVGGILAGGAFGSKIIAALGLTPIILTVLWFAAKDRAVNHPWRTWMGLAGRFAAGFIMVGLPWYAVTYCFTGNPVFPLLNAIFKSPYLPAENSLMNLSTFGIGKSVPSIMALPFFVTFQTHLFGETLPAGAMGVALVMAYPFSVLLLRSYKPVFQVLFVVGAAYSMFWALAAQYTRYFLPVLPVVALAAAIVIEHFLATHAFSRRIGHLLMGLVLAVQWPVAMGLFWPTPERLPYQVALGLKTKSEFLDDTLPGYRAAQHINQVADIRRDRAFGQKLDALRFYLDVPLYSPQTRGLQFSRFTHPDKQFLHTLQSLSVRFILAHASLVDSNAAWRLFLHESARLTFAHQDVYVFDIEARDRETSPPPSNLLKNPGFEEMESNRRISAWHAYGVPLKAESEAQSLSGKMAVRADSNNYLFQSVAVEPDQLYTLSFSCRTDRSDQHARLQINWLDERHRIVGVSIRVAAAGTKWSTCRLYATAPPNAVEAQIYVSVHGDSQVWFDDYWFGKAP